MDEAIAVLLVHDALVEFPGLGIVEGRGADQGELEVRHALADAPVGGDDPEGVLLRGCTKSWVKQPIYPSDRPFWLPFCRRPNPAADPGPPTCGQSSMLSPVSPGVICPRTSRRRKEGVSYPAGDVPSAEAQRQSVGGPKGYDAGRKRQWEPFLRRWSIRQLGVRPCRRLPRLKVIWADNSYRGLEQRSLSARWSNPDRRWIVERTIAWVSRNRRLARDYEAEAFIYLAMIRLLLRRLANLAPV